MIWSLSTSAGLADQPQSIIQWGSHFWNIWSVTASLPYTERIFFCVSVALKKYILFIYFLERGEGREKDRERNINECVVVSHMPPHWGPGLQPRFVPRPGIQPANLWFAGYTQSTEPHQPGLSCICTFLEMVKHNMLKMCIFFHLQY